VEAKNPLSKAVNDFNRYSKVSPQCHKRTIRKIF
jgi:hypothetical protein